MPETKRVILSCCGVEQFVVFDETENPLTAPSLMKCNMICTDCGRVVIISCIRAGHETFIEQEVID